MEEQIQNNQVQSSQGSGMGKYILPTVVVALIVFAAIGYYLYNSSKISNEMAEDSEEEAMIEQSVKDSPVGSSGMTNQAGTYKDGAYSVVGNYVSPGGPRELDVKITLTGGVVTAAEVAGTATDAPSKRFQGEFIQNFKPMVIGKNIDELNLGKVAGSSLSPKGFNDAVTKVKAEAAS